MTPDLTPHRLVKHMPTNLVNLDALIPRADFEVMEDAAPFEQKDTISITDLQPGFFYSALRKPDFQRETASWTPPKIADLITSFLNGDLIPAIILWQPVGGGSIFVIDGTHRLSALIAWVRNDYGDQEISRNYFQNRIPQEQINAAQRTRKLIEGVRRARPEKPDIPVIGSYAEHHAATSHPDKSRPEVLARSKRLGSLALKVQWVNGNADKAEASFFKINQAATPIDPTELVILHARNSPSALTARAIIRAGTGHKYWERFPQENQKSIESTASEIYKNLFSPQLETPIKTLDLPVAGRAYSAQTLPLIFDFVNLVNNQIMISKERYKKVKDTKSSSEENEEKDVDGQKTIEYLNKVRQAANRISGTHPSSLGLHPAIYFYSSTGRHQAPAFLAVAGFIKELHSRRLLIEFTKHREKFEDFLLAHKDFVNQIVRKLGGSFKPYDRLKELYHLVFNALVECKEESEIITMLEKHPELSFLKVGSAGDADEVTSANFSTNTKSAIFLKEALSVPRERCQICHARLHPNSIHIDHIVRKQDGGLGTLENAQLTHPFCNTGYKEKIEADARRTAPSS